MYSMFPTKSVQRCVMIQHKRRRTCQDFKISLSKLTHFKHDF
uniref:Uncharacterized protein n=1 Tax=Anguilla anguilla TaxID=7936 RepID=A0A0E9XUI2_ANGAN